MKYCEDSSGRLSRFCFRAGLLTMAAAIPIIAGAGLPTVITLRTLAEIQQIRDENLLQEKLDSIYQRKAAARSPVIAPVSIAPARSAPSSESPRPAKPKKRPTLRVMSVYGPASSLSVEALDRAGQVHALNERDSIGDWVVTHIRQEGVLLHRNRSVHAGGAVGAENSGTGIFLHVGESLDDGGKP